jgi:hypothetical protein
MAFRYDNTSANKWSEISAETVLAPMDAICLKLSAGAYAKMYPLDTVSGPYGRTFTAGWNLFGPALDISTSDYRMAISRCLTSLDSSDYSQVISQRMGTQQPWVYVPGDTVYPQLQAGEGYWIFMKETGSLQGFSTAPIKGVYAETWSGGGAGGVVGGGAGYAATALSSGSDGVPALPAAFTGTVKDKAGNPIASGKIEVIIDGVVRAGKSFTNGEFGLSLG